MNHINTQTVTTRRWAGIERTLYLLMGLCWVALLSVTLLFVADVAGCERVHTHREGYPSPPGGPFWLNFLRGGTETLRFPADIAPAFYEKTERTRV